MPTVISAFGEEAIIEIITSPEELWSTFRNTQKKSLSTAQAKQNFGAEVDKNYFFMAWVWSFSFFFHKHILTQKYKKKIIIIVIKNNETIQ